MISTQFISCIVQPRKAVKISDPIFPIEMDLAKRGIFLQLTGFHTGFACKGGNLGYVNFYGGQVLCKFLWGQVLCSSSFSRGEALEGSGGALAPPTTPCINPG